MIGASSLAFPGSKTLASWWRQLAHWQPLMLWVGHLFVHRVEALVGSVRSQPLDPLNLFLLKALDLEGQIVAEDNATGPTATSEVRLSVPLARLDARLGLGSAFLLQSLRQLAQDGLVEKDNRSHWLLTGQGRLALAQGHFNRCQHERRVFPFVERLDAAGLRLASPHFLHLRKVTGIPWQPSEDFMFQIDWLQVALEHDNDWKRNFGFPSDVRSIVSLSPGQAANHQANPELPPPGQRIVVDHAERLLVALFTSASNPACLLGLAARQEGWLLQTAELLLTLEQGWPEVLPELTLSTQQESARLAWRNWGKTAGLQTAETDAGQVTYAANRLRVCLPDAVLQKLRGLRSDVFKGDTWLLLGEGRLRAAAILEVVSAG